MRRSGSGHFALPTVVGGPYVLTVVPSSTSGHGGISTALHVDGSRTDLMSALHRRS